LVVLASQRGPARRCQRLGLSFDREEFGHAPTPRAKGVERRLLGGHRRPPHRARQRAVVVLHVRLVHRPAEVALAEQRLQVRHARHPDRAPLGAQRVAARPKRRAHHGPADFLLQRNQRFEQARLHEVAPQVRQPRHVPAPVDVQRVHHFFHLRLADRRAAAVGEGVLDDPPYLREGEERER
jgi:hypothetical protein